MNHGIAQQKQNQSKGFAYSVTQKKNKGRQGLTMLDHRAESRHQKRFQAMADRSPQVKQLTAVQNIIQRYNTTDEGHMVSSQKNLVLESDASKEFYATDVGFSKNKAALERGDVKNVAFVKGAGKKYDALPEKQYSKVMPVFKNVSDTRMKSETQLADEKTEAQVQIPAWYDPFWLWAKLVNMGSGFQPRFYQTYMRNIGTNKHKVDEIGREVQTRDTKNEYIATAIEALDEVLNKVCENSEDEIADISTFFAQPPGVLNVIEKSTRHFIETNWSKQSNKRVREGLKEVIKRRKGELEAQDNDPNAPYLPTDCQKLSIYLRGARAVEISAGKKGPKPKVGDYHHISYSKKDDRGPWDYHFAAILFKDGADTVTLEDAAGQGTSWEKGHWYFMMYGTKGKQTFKAKTDQEYLRRLRITPK